MSKPERQVWCLHKRGDDGKLAVGKTFKFPGSGDAYRVCPDGSVRSNKVKLSKAEKKKQRRERVAELKGDNTPCQK